MKPRLRFQFLLVLAIIQIMVFAPIVSVQADDNQQTATSAILVVNTSFLNIRSGPGANYSIIATVVGGTELPVTGLYEDEVWYQVATNIGLGWVNREFTIGRGDFSSVPLIEYGTFTAPQTTITVTSLGQGGGAVAPASTSGATTVIGAAFLGGDLRTGPSGDAPIVAALLPPDPNTIMPVINIAYFQNRPYYQVNFPGYGVVWSDRFQVRPLECNGLSVIAATDYVGTVPIGVSDPFQLTPGSEVYIAGPGRDGLIEIVAPDGSRGLVPVDKTTARPDTVISLCDGVTATTTTTATDNTAFTTTTVVVPTVNVGQGGGVVVPVLTAAARLIVNTGNLNIRTGPGANYSILATVPGGTELPVTGLYEDEVWYQVATNLGAGWVNREFTIGRGDFSSVPLIEYGTFTAPQTTVSVAALGQGGGVVPTTTTGAATTVIGAAFLGGDLRTDPSGDAPIVAALLPADPNTIMPVMNIAYFQNRPYYQVNFPGYGVVWSDRFQVRPLECNGLSVIAATDYVGTVPIGVSDPFQLTPGSEVYIAGPGRDGLIEIVAPDGSRGLVPVDKTTARPDTVISLCDGVNPGSTVITTTTTNAAVAPVVNVVPVANVGQGGGGAVTSAARVVINTANLNIRTGPSASFSIVATVSGGTTLAVLGVADDGVWYLVEGTFGRGWLNNEFVIFRGDYNAVPVLDVNP